MSRHAIVAKIIQGYGRCFPPRAHLRPHDPLKPRRPLPGLFIARRLRSFLPSARSALNDVRICYCSKPRADVYAKNPDKKGCCSIASATGCQRRRTKQLVEKNWNSPKSRQQSIAGATTTNRDNAESSPAENRLRANQESPNWRPKLSGTLGWRALQFSLANHHDNLSCLNNKSEL